jgi:hypothetical protein
MGKTDLRVFFPYAPNGVQSGTRPKEGSPTGCCAKGSEADGWKRPQVTVYGEASHDLGVEVVEEVGETAYSGEIFL